MPKHAWFSKEYTGTTDSDLVIAAFTELAAEYDPTVDHETHVSGASHAATSCTVPHYDRLLPVKACWTSQPAPRLCLHARLAVGQRTGLRAGHHTSHVNAERPSGWRPSWAERAPLVCGSALAIPLADASGRCCALGTHHGCAYGAGRDAPWCDPPAGSCWQMYAPTFWISPPTPCCCALLIGYGLSLRSAPGRGRLTMCAPDMAAAIDRARLSQHLAPDHPVTLSWYPSGILSTLPA